MNVIGMSVGSQVWYGGDLWEIVELHARTVTLRSGTELRAVQLNRLAATARVVADKTSAELNAMTGEALGTVLLSGLTKRQRAELERRAEALRQIETAGHSSPSERAERVAAAATSMGVSVRTIQRWLVAYRDAGVAGLADNRLLGLRSSGVDPRWDAACLAVLADYTSASTPTMNVVLDRS